MTAPLDFFATDDAVALLEASLQATQGAERVRALVAVAWQLRQRDTRRAMALADEADAGLASAGLPAAEQAGLRARLQLIRGEAKWLFGEIAASKALADSALHGFASLVEINGSVHDGALGCADAHWLLAWLAIDLGDGARIGAELEAMIAAAVDRDPVRATVAQAALARHEAFSDVATAKEKWGAQLAKACGHVHPAAACWVEDYFGLVASLAGDPVQCIRHLSNAYTLALASGQHRRAMIIASNIGGNFNNLNDHQAALEWMRRGLDLARPSGWPGASGTALMQTAETLRVLHRFDAAAEMLQEALALMAPLSASRTYGIALVYLGNVDLDRKHHASALDTFRLLEQRAVELVQADMMAEATCGQAKALLELGQPEPALRAAEAALAAAKSDAYRQITALRVMADIHTRHALAPPPGMRAPSATLHYLHQALDAGATMENYTIPGDLLEAVAQAYADVGDHVQAFAVSKQASQAREKIHSTEASNRASAMQVSHESEKARAEAAHHRQLALAHAERAEGLLKANTTLEQLGRIGREITRKLDAAATFSALDQYVHALLDAPTFAIFRLEPDGMTLSMAFGVEAGQPLAPVQLRLDDPESQNARCARLRQEIVLDFAKGQGGVVAGTLETLSVMFAPLMVDERLLGVMTIQSQQPHAYGEREVAIFRTLCAYGAIALANAEAQAQLIATHAKLTAAHGELERQTQKLQEINEQRTRFLSMTSHEFRTPLATILSSAQLLMHYDARMSPSDKIEVTTAIENGVKRMTEMLDKVLTIGKAEGGMMVFKPAPLNLRVLCEEIAEHARLQWPKSQCKVDTAFDMEEADGLFDEKLVRHIFDNLLSNAIKYSPNGGTVRFAVRQVDDRTVFEVSDEGIGVPPKDLATLFNSFQRASNVGEIPGTGLGLAIAKSSVELHGGSISVTSELGRGTCIAVRL